MNKKSVKDAMRKLEIEEQALAEYDEKIISGATEEEYVNARYEAFQKKLASKQTSQSKMEGTSYRPKTGRKLVLALGIVMVLVILLTVSVVAFNPFKKFFDIFDIHDYAKGSDISYSETYSKNAFLNGTYTYLPKAYQFKEENVGKNYHEQYYESNSGMMIHASTLLAEDTTSVLNTEGTTPKETTIGENKGLYLKTKDGFQVLQWVTGQYVNMLETDDENLDLDDLRKMAESRIKVNT